MNEEIYKRKLKCQQDMAKQSAIKTFKEILEEQDIDPIKEGELRDKFREKLEEYFDKYVSQF